VNQQEHHDATLSVRPRNELFLETPTVKRFQGWLLGGSATGVVVVLLLLYLRGCCLLSIDKDTCDRVQPGMSLAEVEAILGGPPGNYTGFFFGTDASITLTVAGSSNRKQWTGTRGVLLVFFDDQGRVITQMHFPQS
jgi:hypothetical protein